MFNLHLLYWVIVILNIIDFGLTYTIFQNGGGEANPYVDYLIQEFDVVIGIAMAKVPPIAFLGYIIHTDNGKIKSPIIPYIMMALIVVYFIVDVYSYLLLQKLL